MKTLDNQNADEPPSNYTPFEHLISTTYIDHDKIITTVRKHAFEATLHPVLIKVNDYILSNNFDALPHIVGTLLTTINDKLASITGNEKRILEELSSELFKEQITVLNQTEEGQSCWQKCLPVLKETCDFKGYNFLSFSQLMGLSTVKKSRHHTQKKTEDLPYYIWLGEESQLMELIRDLKNKQWIHKVSEFKKIFKPISDPNYTYSATSQHIDKLLVFFQELKNQKFIQPKIGHGHFYPLKKYGIDFGEQLFKKDPKRYLENLKRRKAEYDSVLAEVQKIIRLNCKTNPDL